MVKIHYSSKILKRMAEAHAAALLPLLKKRLNRAINSKLKAYFTSDLSIKELIVCPSKDLLMLNNRIYNILSATLTIPEIDEAAERVFNYKEFKVRDTTKYRADNLCQKLGIQTCLYCNIAPINVAHDITGVVTARPALDHFFSESKHPLLALSFYNLIPSCTYCNTNYKGGALMALNTHLHPYIKGFDDNCTIDFKDYKSIDDILGKKPGKFKLFFKNATGNPRFDGNVKLFHLEDQYRSQKIKAKDALRIAKKYTNAELTSILKMTPGHAHNSYQLVFQARFKLNQLHLNPYSKLKRDIVRNYGSTDLKTLFKLT